MSTYVINGFQEVSFDDFFGEVKGIEGDNVYDTQVFNRAVEKINNEKKNGVIKKNKENIPVLHSNYTSR